MILLLRWIISLFFFQAEDGIRDLCLSRGLGDVYKRQIPAPESSHAIAAAIREANKCKETGEEKVILFNLSGHGLIDMTSYDKYLAGDLVNYSLTDDDIQKNLDEIGDLAK